MRVLLDQELLTMREAQKVLKINRCELEHLCQTGKLKVSGIGAQRKIDGRSLKRLLSISGQGSFEPQNHRQQPGVKASTYEQAVIGEWT